MTTAHLKDSELQVYAANPLLYPDLAAHITGCESCRLKAENYKLLFQGISQMEQPAFDFDLSALVMEQLPAPKRSFPWVVVLTLFFSLPLVVLSTAFFWPAIASVARGMYGMLLPVAGAVIVVIVLFQCIEMLKDHQKQMKVLSLENRLQL